MLYLKFLVISTHHSRCEPGDVLKISSPNQGYIASVTTRETGCGGETSPWLIEAPPGQHVRIILHDFLETNSHIDSSICLMYATINVSILNSFFSIAIIMKVNHFNT